jgi:serine/threonine protein kinase
MQGTLVAGLLQSLLLALDDPLIQCVQRAFEQDRFAGDQWSFFSEAEESVWLSFCKQGVLLPDQGWKLHLSADLTSAELLLQRVLPLLLQQTTSFKLISSLAYLQQLNTGLLGENQIGKFLTIYPANDKEAVALAVELDLKTRGFSGPQIPSDRPLRPDSLIFYRYGGFSSKISVQEPIGLVWPAIRTPDNRLVPDKRKVPYSAPEWSEDPFVAAGLTIDLPEEQRILARRYLVISVIARTIRHTISLAVDLESQRPCILKSLTHRWQNTLPESERKKVLQEADVLGKLRGYERVPALYDIVEQESNMWLVMSDIPGQSLDEWLRNEYVSRFPSFQQIMIWGRDLAEILGVIHQKSVVFADLKPANIMIGPDEKLYLIDFEAATPPGALAIGAYGTRGYASPQQRAGKPRAITDDIYGFGALLYRLVTGAEPSQAPDPAALLTRPIERLRPDVPPVLIEMITHCLQERPEARYTSFREVIALFDDPGICEARSPSVSIPIESAEEDAHALSIARELLHTLCQKAYRPANEAGVTWKTLHPGANNYAMRDINVGHAGTVLALAGLVAELAEEEARNVLGESARWLQTAVPYSDPPLPGLYVGEAGVGAALLLAGQVLDDPSLIAAAVERGRLIATLPHLSPDMMHGTAGRLLFHLLLWDETGEQEHLNAGLACGEYLLATVQQRASGEVCWILPSEAMKDFGTQVYLGYAHGAAGIADSLLDLFEATGDERFKPVIRGAAQWLQRLAIPTLADQRGLSWPATEDQRLPTWPWWCHGSTGIGRFFLHASRHSWLPGAMDTAVRAAQSVIELGKWGGPTLCHGLAGNIEFLLDMYRQTREPVYLASARALSHLLEAFACKREGLLMFQSDVPELFSPDYQVGYAGIAVTFLRLSAPGRIPYQISKDGFRAYKKRTVYDIPEGRAIL